MSELMKVRAAALEIPVQIKEARPPKWKPKATGMLRAVEAERKIKETEELEARVEALEREAQGNGRGGGGGGGGRRWG